MKKYHYSAGNVAAVAAIAGTVLLVGILGIVAYTNYIQTAPEDTNKNLSAQTDTTSPKLTYSTPEGWTVDTTSEVPFETVENRAVLFVASDFVYTDGPDWSGHAMGIVTSVDSVENTAEALKQSLLADDKNGVITLGEHLSGTHADEAWQLDMAYEGTPYHSVALRFGNDVVRVNYYADPSEIYDSQKTVTQQLADETEYMDTFLQLARSINYS